jgi:hypothetical protein
MKKCITILCSTCVFLWIGAGLTAFAAEPDAVDEPTNVNITVVMPDKTAEPTPEPVPTPAPSVSSVYPADVTDVRGDGEWQIIKTYELGANENPRDIPREDFERGGWRFKLTDIIRTETANAETREHTETITLNTDTKDLERIMPLLSQTMEFKTEDGFVGILNLDVASIKVETAGTKTTSYTLSVTREYPHLSANDTELVPKTVTDKGKTYTLAGVEWKAGNYSTVDYERIPDYYTAFATYTATGSSTKVTGYLTTAEYKGTLAKMAQGKTVYTAYFLGKEIVTPLEFVDLTAKTAEVPTETPNSDVTPEPNSEPAPEPTDAPAADSGSEQDSENSAPFGWILVTAILASGCGALVYLLRRQRKEN